MFNPRDPLTADHRQQNYGLCEVLHVSHGCANFPRGLKKGRSPQMKTK